MRRLNLVYVICKCSLYISFFFIDSLTTSPNCVHWIFWRQATPLTWVQEVPIPNLVGVILMCHWGGRLSITTRYNPERHPGITGNLLIGSYSKAPIQTKSKKWHEAKLVRKVTFVSSMYIWPQKLTLIIGPRSAVGNVSGYRCVSDCRSRGREFDPGPVPYFPWARTLILA